jgi:hypothetical protein
MPRNYRTPSYDPSQKDIKEACEKIREKWSEREYQKRSSQHDTPWKLPIVDLSYYVDVIREFRTDKD